MKVLLVGSGGREHALAWALAASSLLTRLYCAPGNPGIEGLADCVPIAAMDFDGLLAFARDKKIDFAVIGPETPLVAGLWDRFESVGIKALGPSGAGAVLEGSKGFVKDLCAENNIPTANYKRSNKLGEALAYGRSQPHPLVIKADGLAQGKGVVISESPATTANTITLMMAREEIEVVFEEFLDGEEASFFVLSDGKNVVPLGVAQDHKRVYDGDKGPNTGGMGAYSPAPVLTEDVIDKTMARIVRPTIAAMAARGAPYMGVLYTGLMIKDGEPKLIEYNCRFGDPECEVLVTRLKSDLLTALVAARDGVLSTLDLRWSEEAALTVVMASKGYPGPYEKGHKIHGLDAAEKLPGVQIFHAGTERRDGQILATGGRVLDVTGTGASLVEARARAYAAADLINWEGAFFRRDIGWRALMRADGVGAPTEKPC